MSRIWISTLFIAALALAACSSASQKATDESSHESDLHQQIGAGYLVSGDNPRALSEFNIAHQLNPQGEVVENNLGLTYFLMKKYGLAEEHFKRALSLKPSYTDARNNLARLHIEMGHYAQAIAELKAVLADLTYPDVDKAWVNLGMAYFRKGDYQEAKDKLAEALRINRNNCLAYDLYGRSQLELHQYQDAAVSLDQAVSLCQEVKFDEPHYYSGLAYQKLGNSAKAVARMEEVTRLYPNGAYAKKAQSMLNLMTK